jgi:HPt (histidine-containing phosphotransfer) domain-containing protein
VPTSIALDKETPVLDQSRLLEQFGGEPEIMAELRDLFLEDFPQQLAAIKEGIAGGDAAQVARAAHSLKGASGTFGAERVYLVTKALEEMARADDLAGVEFGLALLQEELDQVCAAIGNLIPER